MIINLDDFAESVKHLDWKVEYLRLMGFECVVDFDNNLVHLGWR
jgi:hypothetical protein